MPKTVSEIIKRDLEAAFSDVVFQDMVYKIVKPTVIRRINERVERGDFLSGDLANKGYSESALPAFFLGDIKKISTGSSTVWKIQNTELNITIDATQDIIWRNQGDTTRSFLIGGYKKFRELAGRRTDRVRLQFTGTMMRGLDTRISINDGHIVAKTGVFNERAAVSGYLDNRREFINLSDKEEQELEAEIYKYIDNNLPSETLT